MMIDYKENLINENSELNLYDPITKLVLCQEKGLIK